MSDEKLPASNMGVSRSVRAAAPYDSTADTLAHIDRVRHFMTKALNGLLIRAQEHDRSKLSPPEKACFDEFTPMLSRTRYGDAQYERAREEMGRALAHHYEHNRHHPEHFGDAGIEGMNLLDMLEMLCDWLAAVERHDDGDIRRSVAQNAVRFGYGEQIATLLMNTVDALEDAPVSKLWGDEG